MANLQPKQIINIESKDFTPLKGYVLIKPEIPKREEKTDSGIITTISKTLVESRPCTGIVIKSNNKKILENDYVIFPSTDGLDCQFLDGEFELLRVQSIIGYKRN